MMNVVVRCLTLSAVLFAAYPNVGWCGAKEDLNQLEHKRYDTLIAGDFAAYSDLLADEFVYNHAFGGTITKAPHVAYLKSGETKVRKAVLDEPEIRLYGDVALVTGTSHVYITVKGEERTNHYRYLHVWTRKGDNWKLVARQATFVPEQK